MHIIHHTYAARAYVSTEHAQKGNRKSSSSYAIQDNLIYNSHFVYNSQHYKPQVAAAAEEVFICKRATGGGFVCVSIDYCRQTRRRAAAQTQQQTQRSWPTCLHTAVRAALIVTARTCSRLDGTKLFFFSLIRQETDANKNVQHGNYRSFGPFEN